MSIDEILTVEDLNKEKELEVGLEADGKGDEEDE